MPAPDKWYQPSPQVIFCPDIYLLIVSTEAGNGWEVSVLQLKGSNKSYLLDIDFVNCEIL